MNYNQHNNLHNVLITLFFITSATLIGWLFNYWGFSETNIVVVYIVSVLLTARFTYGYFYGMAATIIATLMFNYFFTDPRLTFSVNDPTYLITFAIMTITSIITSTLTTKVKQTALNAQEKEAEASALYQLTNHLTDAKNISEIVSITVTTISNILSCRAACLCFDENGLPEQSFIQQKSQDEQVYRKLNNAIELKRRMADLRTEYDISNEFYDWPIYGHENILGVLRIPKEHAIRLSDAQNRLLHSVIECTALAMDRFRSSEERMRSKEEIEQERYRGNLLRAISHDLRTPLSGIMGTSEMLMDMIAKDDERYALAEGIHTDANWLHSLVENILGLTRLQDGKLVLNRQMEPVEEVVGAAAAVIEKRTPKREITINIPENIMLVPMDAKLIGQVLINLLDNAAKHTSVQKEISITVSEDTTNNNAVFVVADRGSGIAPEDLQHIFQMFYTTHRKSADAQRGVGLGLTICESIVKAHGGTISAQNRTDGTGAVFTFTLPMEDKSHEQAN